MVDGNVVGEVIEEVTEVVSTPAPVDEVGKAVQVTTSSFNLSDIITFFTKMVNGVIQMLAINVIIFLIFLGLSGIIYFLLGRLLGNPHGGSLFNSKALRAILAFLIGWLVFPYILPFVYPVIISFINKGGV